MDLKDALQESRLPMLVDVHDWAHLPEEFHQNIERDYVVIRDGLLHRHPPRAPPAIAGEQ
jgi:hypothetical protein